MIAEDHKKVVQELALAWEIQASFLPDQLPVMAGWQLSAALEPARETSGDFYDFIPLPDERWGIVIGDVADKGAGAALFMALSWSLIRTYLAVYPSQPARALEVVNRRILQDTLADQFVTAFVGVLDPAAGMLEYGSAGHCPALLVRGGGEVQRLGLTGIALGVLEDEKWEQQRIPIDVGDLLVVYTDGVTEARNRQGDLFRLARLQRAAEGGGQRSAVASMDKILADVNAFTGREHLEDDIALIVLQRVAGLPPW